eukprot:3426413-Ditylum_brightwellii.AAC.1
MPYNSNSPTYNLAVLFSDTGTVKEWLKFLLNIQVVIAGQTSLMSKEPMQPPRAFYEETL